MRSRVAEILLGLLLLGTVAGAAWYYRAHPVDIGQLLSAPCAKPLPYRIGDIDPRFHLTKEEIAGHLREAAGLWEEAAGRPLLAYAPDDPSALPVNFVYDARQQSITLGQKIDTTEASQETERAAIENLQAAYVAAQRAYADAVESFNEASRKYAAEVRRVNATGGADPATYERLQAEQAKLKEQQAALNAQGAALEAQGKTLQSRIASFNAGVRQINQVVQAFNQAVGGEFEEGLYVRDESGKAHIDIYAYKTETELLHSLTHEFGHALGLSHNQNPASIMFPYNKSGIVLSEDDIAALRAACQLD